MVVRFLSAGRTGPKISWHRGGTELAPSASLAAFVAAAEHGAEFVEVDVRATRDNVLICVHDEQVEGLGRVDELDYGSLSSDDQARLVTAEQLRLALASADPDGHTGIHLDLKVEGYETRAIDALATPARPLFVTTPSVRSIRAVREGRPTVSAYLTIGTSRQGLSRGATMKLRLSELFPHRRLVQSRATGVAVHYALATPLLRWWCRAQHLDVVVWTVDRPALVEAWLTRDIDVLTTNRPMFALERRAALQG